MVDEQIKESNFLLQNRFDDIWFFDHELIRNFNSLLFDMVVNFYQGPFPLTKLEELVLRQSGENDCHLVVFKQDVFKIDEELQKLKKFRLFNTKNVFKSIHLKYWVCDDVNIAKQIGITTEGDLYVLRPT